MIYELPPLPYDYDALEPYIDARTMEIHYTKHHAGYVAKLNKVLEHAPALANVSLEDILADIRRVPEEIRQEVRNQGGGHLNHSLFWQTMTPSQDEQPSGLLRDAIISTFGDVPGLKEELFHAAISRFGSGWAWLGVDHNGKLEVVSTPNQDSPLMLGYHPVLGVDVWEHAYYLKYQNRRTDYLTAWWNVVDWGSVARLYHRSMDLVKGHNKHEGRE